MAIAADAPQIAVAPPVRMPMRRERPSAFAAPIAEDDRDATPATMSPPLNQPRPPIWSIVIRAPSSATPKRRMRRATKSTPGLAMPSTATALSAMPSSSA